LIRFHGNTIVLDFAWDQLAGGPPVSFSGITLTDRTGRTFGWHTSGVETTLHATVCNTHFDSGADRGATWAIFVCFAGCHLEWVALPPSDLSPLRTITTGRKRSATSA
jgi:hypothetical protein